ncbi:hypothetical protein HK096_010216 [Nowakowskiella sp. JEL0078]|nr:hypothetical protein HK096_010216 [Nowakowskiella sp. JEL0078]
MFLERSITQISDFMVYLVSSSIAAFVARLLTHPLETVKIRIQSGTIPGHPTNPFGVFFWMIEHEGWLSLFSGLTIALIFSVPALVTYITTYDTLKPYVAEGLGFDIINPLVHLLCGAIAEVVSNIFWTPMEVIKARQQVSKTPVSAIEMINKIYAAEGTAGFFRGYLLGVAVYVPHSMIFFLAFEQIKIFFIRTLNIPDNTSLPVWSVMISSIIAAATGAAASNIVDVVKTKWQIAGRELALKVSGFQNSNDGLLSDSLNYGTLEQNSIFVEEGSFSVVQKEKSQFFNMLLLMWKDGDFLTGMTARVLWIVPSATIFFTIDELLKGWWIKGF